MTAEDTMKACLEVLALLGCLGCMRATGSVSPRVDPIPPIPTEEWVAPDDTVAFPVTAPTVGGRYYLSLVGVKFMGGADPGEAASVLARYGATVVGGLPNIGAYVLHLATPAADADGLGVLLDRLNAEPTVDYPIPLAFRSSWDISADWSDDCGSGARRHHCMRHGIVGPASRRRFEAVRRIS